MARFLKGAGLGMIGMCFLGGLVALLLSELASGSLGRGLSLFGVALMIGGVIVAALIRFQAVFAAGYSIDDHRLRFSDGGAPTEIELRVISEVDWVSVSGMPPHSRLILNDGTDVFVPSLDFAGSERLRHELRRR